jgi:GT2 family glycosyltransferase
MISIIIPVIRPDKAERCIEAVRRNAGDIDYEIVTEQDTDGIGCPRMVKRLTERSRGSAVMFLGDDTVPEPGFLATASEAMARLPGGWGVVGLNTQDDRPGVGSNDRAHWLASKRMLAHIPGGAFFAVDYHHCYGDDELQDIALELGRWAYASDARIRHDHPVNGTADYDDGYRRAYDLHVNADRKTYYRRKIARRGLGIGVGVPLTGTTVNRQFASSYRQAMYAYLLLPDHPRIIEYEPDVPIGEFAREIAHNRNDLVRRALHDGISHLIMMDSDQIYPTDIIVKLAAWAARGKQFVSAPVHRRYDPFELIMLRGAPDQYENIPDDEKYSGKLIPIDATGCGCIMFSLAAALEIDEPWFEFTTTPSGAHMGEDIAFCAKMRANGVQIYADTSIEIDHIAEIAINREFHEIYKRLNRNYFGATTGGH